MIYGYLRLSTKGQAKDINRLDIQERILKEHGRDYIHRLFYRY